MTSSGFPSALCYSELSRLRSYSSSPPLFSTPSSEAPLTQRACHAHVSPLTHVEVSQSALVTYAACLSLWSGMGEAGRCDVSLGWANASTSILRQNIFQGHVVCEMQTCVCVYFLEG